MTYEGAKPPYPLFIHLDGERVVVVGAGAVAQRKIETLLEYGARVTAIAPEATERIRSFAEAGDIALIERPYEEGDLEGVLLAVVATSSQSVNEQVFEEASRLHILVNVVDVPPLCNCIVPSIMRRGQLQIAVSTVGAAPSVAREIRRSLESQFPAYWEDYIELLGQVRSLVKQRVPGEASVRTPLFEAVGSAGIEHRLAAGEKITAQQVYDEVVAPLVEGGRL